MARYIASIDQGTTGTTCILFDEQMHVVSRAYQEIRCTFPSPGWVSQDPEELWTSCLVVLRKALRQVSADSKDVVALGITNQRETTIVWDLETGRPIHEAIVWQCRRTAPIVENWLNQGLGQTIVEKTGLITDAYFSASKIAHILDQVPGARARAEAGKLAFGTVDTWILWKLTNGKVHATEPSNAARTMLFNIHNMEWDSELLEAFDIPAAILPEVRPTSGLFGVVESALFGAEIPVCGIAGDQQAALFGQCCFNSGDIKNTYGTGCFLVMNTGDKPFRSRNKLLTTIAWSIDNKVCYALEGSVFSAGSGVQWLRDGLGIIRNAAETEAMAASLDDNGGVYFVPAFSGLGAPYWDPYARATAVGMTRDTRPAHLARAVLEATAYQTRDLVEAMSSDCGITVGSLRVDGGMTANSFLMQFQADLLNAAVERPKIVDSTAMGAAALAGLAQGMFDMPRLRQLRQVEQTFIPKSSDQEREVLYQGWRQAVKRTLSTN